MKSKTHLILLRDRGQEKRVFEINCVLRLKWEICVHSSSYEMSFAKELDKKYVEDSRFKNFIRKTKLSA